MFTVPRNLPVPCHGPSPYENAMTTRLLSVLPLVAVIALSGCTLRTGNTSKKPVETSGDASSEVMALRESNARLESQLAQARKELDAGKGGTAGDETKAITGGPIEGFEPTARGGLALPDDFAFAKGSATLNDDGEKAVARLAARLNEGDNAGQQVIVEGHTDASPVSRPVTKEKFTDNWGLSGARAASVVRALEKAGVNAARLHGAFRGEHSPRVAVAKDPKDAGKSEGDAKHNDANAANRRVEIFLGK